jgi:hypothetical protein
VTPVAKILRILMLGSGIGDCCQGARRNRSVVSHCQLDPIEFRLVSEGRRPQSPTGGLASGLLQWARSIWSSRTN